MKTAKRLAIQIQTGGSLVILAALLWHISLPKLDDGKQFSHMSAIPAFLLARGCFICVGLTVLLAWAYFRNGRRHTGIFLIAASVGLSPALRIIWPHTEWAAPPAMGLVVDARSQQPIAGILVSRVEPPNVAAETTTDSSGAFVFDGIKKVRWGRWESQPMVVYRVAVAGFQTYSTWRWGPGRSFARDYRDQIEKIELVSE